MQFSSTDRVLAALACAYFCYRVLGAVRSGVYDGDGDLDVDCARDPGAFALTLITGAIVAVLLAIVAISPGSA